MLVQSHDTGGFGEPQALSLIEEAWMTEVVLKWLYSPGHTDTTAIATVRGVCDESTSNESVSGRI
jgi:hypothetical protein